MHVVHTRVAVVQLAYHPAIVADRRSPLEDPLWHPGKPDSLEPPGEVLPEALAPRFDALRRRIRGVYGEQILARVREILASAGRLGARIIVFPDYSLPWEILGGVADAAGELVVVAGAHTVERAVRRSGLYERLGVAHDARPSAGQVVCPVLHRGSLLSLVPRLGIGVAEGAKLQATEAWAPVSMPDGIAGPMGVIAAQDFLELAGGPHRAALVEALAPCRFLAMPSFGLWGEGEQRTAKAWAEARVLGRPVLYAAAASIGGTSVFVDEGRPAELRAFPDRAGMLEPGDEGVIVAGVNLHHDRTAKRSHSMAEPAVVSVAAATLLYRAHPVADAYAGHLLDAASDLLARDDGGALDALATRVEQARDGLLNVGALPGAKTRQRRLSRLLAELDKITTMEDMRRFLRDVVLPPGVLPLGDLRAAMAGAAADCVFAWMRDARSDGLQSVEMHLRADAQAIGGQSEWTSEGAQALARVAQAVRELPAPPDAHKPAEKAPSAREAVGPDEIPVVLPAGIDPTTIGTRRNGGFLIAFRARPEEFLRREQELQHRDRDEPRSTAPGSETDPFASDFSEMHLWAAEDLSLLAIAGGAERVTVAAVRPEGEAFGAMLILSFQKDAWVAWEVGKNPWLATQWDALHRAFEETGIGEVELDRLDVASYQERLGALLQRFEKARRHAIAFRDQRLREVGGHFVEPDVRIGTDAAKVPLLEALDGWLKGGEQTALILGEFGSGKSTGLAEWAVRRWDKPSGARPILVNLAGAPASRDADSLLLEAAGVEDTRANRAALRILIRRRLIVACFDGFDEMATRLDATDLSGRLSSLVELGRSGGKVVISSRDSYFPTEADLRSMRENALVQALGASSGIRHIWVQPFTKEQVAALVGMVRPDSVAEALDRIARTYDLKDLVTRPLLLGMLLSTLDDLAPGAKVGTADLYEAHLGRWLEQTRSNDPECFTDKQKVEFAESLAEQLWRSGKPSCTWQEIQQSVRARLSQHLPEGMPIGTTFLELQGGAFFVRDGEGRYRFAHKSFLEYFLARGLIHTLAERPREALATRPITQEVAAFVGEILKRQGNPKHEIAITTVKVWLGGKMIETAADAEAVAGLGKIAAASKGGPEYDAYWKALAESKANALRLLLGLARWSNDPRGWIPERAHLRHVTLAREDLTGATLVGAHLDGADLTGVNLTDADLSHATLDSARLDGVLLTRTNLSGVTAHDADFTQAEADQANLSKADLCGSILRQSIWTNCIWRDVTLEGAEVTGWAAPGVGGATDNHSTSIASPNVFVTLAAGHADTIRSMSWHPSGNWLATAGFDDFVRIFHTGTGAELTALNKNDQWVTAVEWNPHGMTLASVGSQEILRLWDYTTGKEIAQVDNAVHKINTLAWHPLDNQMVGAGSRGNLVLWDTANRKRIAKYAAHDDEVLDIAFDPRGNSFASVGSSGTVHVWNVADAKTVAQFSGYNGTGFALAWTRNDIRLATTAYDKTIKIFDLEGNKEIADCNVQGSHITSLCLDREGSRLATAETSGTVRLWETETGKELSRIPACRDRTFALSSEPAGMFLINASTDGTVRFWNVESGKQVYRDSSSGNPVVAAAWSATSRRLAVATESGNLRIVHMKTGKVSALPEKQLSALAWDPSGARLAFVSGSGTVVLWHVDDERKIVELEKHKSAIHAIAWSPNGACLATASSDRALRLWDATTGMEIAYQDAHKIAVRTMAWNPAGNCLACVHYDGSVTLWYVDGNQVIPWMDDPPCTIHALAWDPTGSLVAGAAGDGSVIVWQSDTHDRIARFHGSGLRMRSVTWNHTGTRLAGAENDGAVRIWDSDRGILLGVFEAVQDNSLLRTPGGFCQFGGGDPHRYRLALRRPDSQTRLFLPLAGLRAVLHRPDKVKAALSGDLSGDDLRLELEKFGFDNGIPWDGKARRIERIESLAPPPPPAAPKPVAAPAPNPFRPGPALTGAESLPGREPVVGELIALIEGRSPAILRGPRRCGKTSILHLLCKRLDRSRHIVHVTLEGTRIVTPDDLARVLDPALKDRPAAADTLRLRFREERNAVLLLDEVANLEGADPTVFAWLRAVGQEEAAVVLAGSHWDWVRVVEHAAKAPGSSFGNDVTPVDLGPLSEADALRFLVDSAPPDVPMEEERTAKWIVELCGPWPFYLQVMGHAVVQAVRAGSRLSLVDRRGVSDLYEQRLLLDRDAVFRGRFAELPERVKRALFASREGKLPLYRELSRDDRKILRDTGLCNPFGHWLDDRPFFDWIRRSADDPEGAH